MIDAYVWTTPNGYKALIALEELGLPYRPRWIDLGKGQQTTPEFLAINPNNKIPAIVDHEGPAGAPITVFESGAVLLYLADKAGALIAKEGEARYHAIEWAFFNAGGTGPMLGQLGWFKRAKEAIPVAIERYTLEGERLLGVLDRRLGDVEYLAGEYSIADVMNFPWIRGARDFLGFDLARYPNLARWVAAIEKRPAVVRALAMKP
jgi:GST-like protein